MCGNLLCGGKRTSKQCMLLDQSKKKFEKTSIGLNRERIAHLCLNVEDEGGKGVWLIGGRDNTKYSELLNPNGTERIISNVELPDQGYSVREKRFAWSDKNIISSIKFLELQGCLWNRVRCRIYNYWRDVAKKSI